MRTKIGKQNPKTFMKFYEFQEAITKLDAQNQCCAIASKMPKKQEPVSLSPLLIGRKSAESLPSDLTGSLNPAPLDLPGSSYGLPFCYSGQQSTVRQTQALPHLALRARSQEYT